MLFCVGILNNTSSFSNVWLGGSVVPYEGTWVWTDGSPGNLFKELIHVSGLTQNTSTQCWGGNGFDDNLFKPN